MLQVRTEKCLQFKVADKLKDDVYVDGVLRDLCNVDSLQTLSEKNKESQQLLKLSVAMKECVNCHDEKKKSKKSLMLSGRHCIIKGGNI